MKKEEICKLCVPPNYGFGDTGNPELGIPPNTSLVYEIQLLSFINVCYGYRTSISYSGFFQVFGQGEEMRYNGRVGANILSTPREGGGGLAKAKGGEYPLLHLKKN